MDRLARLEAIEAIRALKARYFRLIDTKAWDELPDVFTPDMQVITPEGAIYAQGGDTYANSLAHSLGDAVSCHQGLTAEIEILDDDQARAVWAMQDIITWSHAHPRTGWKSIHGCGHYHESYRRCTDGAWRMSRLQLTRLRLDVTWPEGRSPA